MKYVVICECKVSYLLRYVIRMTHKFETCRHCVLTVLILSIMLDRRKCYWTYSAGWKKPQAGSTRKKNYFE